ncbi:hypothetical protein [Phytohabitans kaempferiae]|uniref:Uncharacterized protein n=1 Tax=Phytohabitans kaempferiae TaxID=1620943 RepID=A0ABV6M387_9ACTN
MRNPTIGRELVRLCVQAGFQVRSVDPVAVLFRDFGTADHILGLRRDAARAARAGRDPDRESALVQTAPGVRRAPDGDRRRGRSSGSHQEARPRVTARSRRRNRIEALTSLD